MDKTRLVVVQKYSNEINAEIAKQKLASHGVEAFISKDDNGGMLSSLQTTLGVRLEVLESNQKKAERILKELKK
ncbi:MAG: DUF2007 domain-containing protein [Bacteroidota bacterium]|nr:DUF2007 domain-containing protein [Bacteroidota bacterium]